MYVFRRPANALGADVTELESTDHRISDLVAGFDTGTPERDVFTIRDLAKEFAISARTLRFYEEKGLLDPARRGDPSRRSCR